jgi:hypothetical protein
MDLRGIRQLVGALREMPAAARTRILVPAATKGARAIASSIRKFIPVQKRMSKPHTHYRDAVTQKVAEYIDRNIVTAFVGAESGIAPHAHLVEDGTGPRGTNHKTRYVRTAIRARLILKKGKLQYKTDRARKSVGSFLKSKSQASKNKFSLGVYFRGRMPAFHPVVRGLAAVEGQVAAQLKTDIQAGITRELTEAKLARGV